MKGVVGTYLSPQPELSDRARQRIEAEVRARWPYYRKSKKYLLLADEHERLMKRFGKVLPPQQPPTDEKEFAEVCDGLDRISTSVREQYGMSCLIEPRYSADYILKDSILSRFFCPDVGQAAICTVTENPPVDGREDSLPWRRQWLKDIAEYLASTSTSEKDYLWKYRWLPVTLFLHAPKQEILAAVGEIIDIWQTRWKKAGLSYEERDRQPDTALFSHYVKAFELKEQDKTLKQIAGRLFPGDTDPNAAERKAELYVQNGELLIRGQSYRIGQR